MEKLVLKTDRQTNRPTSLGQDASSQSITKICHFKQQHSTGNLTANKNMFVQLKINLIGCAIIVN